MTRATIVLVGHSLRRMRTALIGLGILLAGFEFLLTQIAVYLLRRSAFGELSMLMPEFVRTVAGPSALAFMSFSGIVALGYFHPAVIGSAVGLMIAIATEPAGEVETRFADLILSRPLGRAQPITRTLVVLAVSGNAILALMITGTRLGLACCTPKDSPHLSPGLIGSLAVSLATVMMCWAGVTLAIAAASRRRAVAGSIAGGAALAAYLLDYVGRAWEPARGVSALSPFHYFEPMSLVAGQPLSGWNMSVLTGIGVAGTIVAYTVFRHRDI